jgi:hypothetical protein
MYQAMVALDSKNDMTKAEWRYLQYHAFNDLRERLAQPEREWQGLTENEMTDKTDQRLYTAPPEQERREWQGLFFDAVYEAWHSAGMDVLGGDWNTFASKLEEKLKETK